MDKKTREPFSAEPLSYVKGLFLPLVAMLGLVGISGVLFNSASAFLLDEGIKGVTKNGLLSLTGFTPAFITLLMFVFILSQKPIRAWLSPLIAIFIGGQLILALLTSWEGAGSAIYFLSRLLNPAIFSILLWGFANQVTEISEGMKYYIPIAFFSALLLAPFSFFEKITSVDTARLFLLSSTLALAATWAIYRQISKRIPEKQWTEEPKGVEPTNSGNIFRFALAFGAFGLMRGILNPLFTNSLKTNAPSWLGYYPIVVGVGVLAVSTLCYFIGPWLLKRTGWLLTALTPSLIVTQFVAIFYVFFLTQTLVSEVMTLNEVLIQSLYTALLFPILQIGYLSLPKGARFHTKAWAEIIFAPLILTSGTSILNALLATFRAVENILPYVAPLSIGIAILMAFAIGPIGKRKALLQKVGMK